MKTTMNFLIAIFLTVAAATSCQAAFAPVGGSFARSAAVSRTIQQPPKTTSFYQPVALQRQRKSVASVQTMGLFGLGAPEIAIILVAAAFLLGPQKLAELGKDAGKIAGELKEVPKEFQKGLEEGEAQARSLKAKNMEEVKDADKEE